MRIRSCVEVTHLVLAGQDRTLDPIERQAVRVHWRLCEGCRHFARHVRLTRVALAQWRRMRDH
jgi:hypothetical protein